MKHLAASIKDRLLNLSRSKGGDFNPWSSRGASC